MSKRKAPEAIENSLTKIIKRDNLGKAKKYLEGTTTTPYQRLLEQLKKDQKLGKGDHVLHWFRNDLRIHDNKALYKASKFANSIGKPLITVYIFSQKDFDRHYIGDLKIDLILRNLLNLQKKLKKLKIPLIIDSIPDIKYLLKIDEIFSKYKVVKMFANFEYEIHELNRDNAIAQKHNFELLHDQCIVEPELIKSKTGSAFKVFKLWYNEWCKFIYNKDSKLKLEADPIPNKEYVEVEENNIDIKKIGLERGKLMKSLYTDDEEEVLDKLDSFIKSDLEDYETEKDFPITSKSSSLSPYINIGLISTRTIVSRTLNNYDSKNSKSSSTAFIREVAWRDFYRHKIVEFPHVVMNRPFNLKTENLSWNNDPELFDKWCKGETGFPIVDLTMKKLNKEGYINNRCRMIVSNLLVKNLHVDWRYGEQYFMSKLIDADFASNNGGWGFVSSTGVNCQPFFRVFNPLLQQKNFDHDYEFVKKWIPDFDQDNYIEPIVDYKTSKEEFIENFRGNVQ